MPPKGNNTEEQFLAACFKHCTDKPKVDFNKLAETLGMSAGGASNKFRAIMKKFEDEGGASWAGNGSTTIPPTPATPSKRKTTGSAATTPASSVKKTPRTRNVKKRGPQESESGSGDGTTDGAGDTDEGKSDEDQKPDKKKLKIVRKKVNGAAGKAKSKVDTSASKLAVDAQDEDGTKDDAGDSIESTGRVEVDG